MANRNQRKASELRGLSIYQDPKKGTIYYDWLTRKGYQLTSSDVGTYSLSQSFLPVAIVLAYGLYRFFSMDIKNAIIGGIIGYLVMKLIYRFAFLNKLPFIRAIIPNADNATAATIRIYIPIFSIVPSSVVKTKAIVTPTNATANTDNNINLIFEYVFAAFLKMLPLSGR